MNTMVDRPHPSLAEDSDDFVGAYEFEIKRHVG